MLATGVIGCMQSINRIYLTCKELAMRRQGCWQRITHTLWLVGMSTWWQSLGFGRDMHTSVVSKYDGIIASCGQSFLNLQLGRTSDAIQVARPDSKHYSQIGTFFTQFELNGSS
jgi:hypothetical protein